MVCGWDGVSASTLSRPIIQIAPHGAVYGQRWELPRQYSRRWPNLIRSSGNLPSRLDRLLVTAVIGREVFPSSTSRPPLN